MQTKRTLPLKRLCNFTWQCYTFVYLFSKMINKIKKGISVMNPFLVFRKTDSYISFITFKTSIRHTSTVALSVLWHIKSPPFHIPTNIRFLFYSLLHPTCAYVRYLHNYKWHYITQIGLSVRLRSIRLWAGACRWIVTYNACVVLRNVLGI
jgi:hypothetical protein